MKRLVSSKIYYAAVAILILAVLVLHMLRPELRIDWVTLVLLAMIILLPIVPYIRQIRFRGVELDIGEIEKFEGLATSATRATEPLKKLKDVSSEEHLTELAQSEPALAIADLGFDMEWKLHQLLELSPLPEKQKRKGRRLTLNKLSDLLQKHKVIDSRIRDSIRLFVDIRNKAMHGAHIKSTDAARVIVSGLAVVRDVEASIYQILTPSEVKTITNQEEEEARTAQYRVTTIAPYVDRPEMRVYVMNMDELDSFLEGYEEYAEYVVSVEKI